MCRVGAGVKAMRGGHRQQCCASSCALYSLSAVTFLQEIVPDSSPTAARAAGYITRPYCTTCMLCPWQKFSYDSLPATLNMLLC